MTDKNNIEMKTGDIVRVENAYFQTDNGLYYIEHTPGDPTWCGNDYSLHKICKNGKVSTASRSIAFWPLAAFTNDREKNAAAREHNKEHATIEVIHTIDNSAVIAHFEEEAEHMTEQANTWAWRFGEDSETTQKARRCAAFYQGIADSMKDTTPEDTQEATQEAQEATENNTQEETHTMPKYYEISEETARRGHESIHMSDYKPGSATNEYRASVDEAAQIAEAQKAKTSPFYHDKIDALLDKYARKLAQWYNDYNRNSASCVSWFISGPANYPVRKHERQMNRERVLWDEYSQIKGIIDKIKSVGTGPIDLADPNARAMLTERLEKLQKELDRSKEINAYYRKHKTLVGIPGMTPEKAEAMTNTIREEMERCPWIKNPVPEYELTSIRGKIKRTQESLSELDRRQDAKAEDEAHDGFTIVKNPEIDRLQILFDEIPDAETRQALKSHGFHWSPANKAWQRQLTDNAERAARQILKLA